jgi:hypothetical protein
MKSCPFYKIGLIVLALANHNLCLAQDQDEQLTVNATTTDVEDLSKKEDIKESDKLAAIFKLQKQLVYKLLKNIGITPDKLSPAIKNALNKPQTTSLVAFKAFSNCLDLKDKGKFEEARVQCEKAVKSDPNFVLAQQFLQSIPDRQQNMQDIVSDHMNRLGSDGLRGSDVYAINTINTIPPNEPPLQIPRDLGGEDCQTSGAGGGCQVESSPPCNNNGTCGFYSTFLARRSPDGGITIANSPYVNRSAVGVSSSNSGNISLIQAGQGNGYLNLQVEPDNQIGQITAFREGQFNQGNANIPEGQLERNVTDEFPTGDNGVTGLELGSYLTGFDFDGRLGKVGGQDYDLFHGAIYFAEGKVTPIDTVKNLGKVTYEGVVNGDFSINGNLVPCQGECGSFTSTLNYSAGRLERFNLQAEAEQVAGNATAAARITARNVGLKPTGEFLFDHRNGSFRAGTSLQKLSPAAGVVAGRPFGNRGELLGGVFAIHGGGAHGAGNFGGERRGPRQ